MMDAAYFARARELIGERMGGFAPELVLSLLVIVLLMHDLFTRGARPERAAGIAGIGLGICGALLLMQSTEPPTAGHLEGSQEIFGWLTGDGKHMGMLAIDAFAKFFKAFVFLGTLVTISMCLVHPATSLTRSVCSHVSFSHSTVSAWMRSVTFSKRSSESRHCFRLS